MKAVHSKHTSLMHRHMHDGTDVERFEEGTITFVASVSDLKRIRGVKANGHSVVIDHSRGTADHGTHMDPAIIVDTPTMTFLQIFLCGADAGEAVPKVAVVLDDGSVTIIDTVRHVPDEDADVSSSLARKRSGWTFEISGGSVTPIWQHSRFGTEMEMLSSPIAGNALLRVPNLFSDRLGLCLTTDDVFGGTEHKHLLHGEAGLASGRWVFAGGNMHAPRSRRMPAYRSAVAKLLDGDVPPVDAFAGFDELQLFCRPEHADLAMHDYAESAAAVSVMTVSEFEDEDPDILLVDPRGGYFGRPDRPISMLLFADQNDRDYPDRLKAAASMFRHLPQDTPVLESAWFSEGGIEPERGIRYYGIGYSHSSADFPKGMVDLTRRMMVPDRQLCGTCQRSGTCLDMLATPWAKTVQPGQDGCTVKDAIDLLYRD
ncbi:hypothetical protein G6L37_02340 [Agrobacterium rubi]|nr:hypothetical protein [Agrobacterium rubi]NTF24234.1 hypothetical protein [Agrobacterium rubi]